MTWFELNWQNFQLNFVKRKTIMQQQSFCCHFKLKPTLNLSNLLCQLRSLDCVSFFLTIVWKHYQILHLQWLKGIHPLDAIYLDENSLNLNCSLPSKVNIYLNLLSSFNSGFSLPLFRKAKTGEKLNKDCSLVSPISSAEALTPSEWLQVSLWFVSLLSFLYRHPVCEGGLLLRSSHIPSMFWQWI